MLHVSNLFWLIASVAAFILILPRVPSRRGRAAVILGCAVALLFPVISVSDDFADGRASFEQLLATLVAVCLALLLTAVARITPAPTRVPAFAPATKSDPRSPPRR